MLGTVSTFYDVDAVLIAVSFLTMMIKVRIIIVPINVHGLIGLRSRLESLLEWPSPSPSLRSRPRLTSPPVEVGVIIVLLFIILYYIVYSSFFSTLFIAFGGCRHKYPCRFKHFDIFALVSNVLFWGLGTQHFLLGRCWHLGSTLDVNTYLNDIRFGRCWHLGSTLDVNTYQKRYCFGRCQHLPKEVLLW